uniref:Ig-like domain-containing protein n=1 Tax=Meleagris gallopavo TaxID=9103 RepID=A0A803Y0R6_MELGA
MDQYGITGSCTGSYWCWDQCGPVWTSVDQFGECRQLYWCWYQYKPVQTSINNYGVTGSCTSAGNTMDQYGSVWTSMDQYGGRQELYWFLLVHEPVWTSMDQYRFTGSCTGSYWYRNQYRPVRTGIDQYGCTGSFTGCTGAGTSMDQFGPVWGVPASLPLPVYTSMDQYGLTGSCTGSYWCWDQYRPVWTSSTSATAPVLFPLVPCSPSATLYTVGCAAFNFQPNTISFSWADSSNRSVTALNFGSVITSGRGYRATSRLQMTQTEGKERQPFRCRATHPQGNAEITVTNSDPLPPTPLLLTIHPPSREDFEGPFRNASVLCQTRGRRQPKAVTWYKNGVSIPGGVTTVAKAGTETVAESRVEVTEGEWDSGVIFSCLVDGEMRNTSKRMECGLDPIAQPDITVLAIPPSFVDIFISGDKNLSFSPMKPNVFGIAPHILPQGFIFGEKYPKNLSFSPMKPNFFGIAPHILP